VLLDQYTAVGFIITATGFAGFKQLDDRKFVEYVLVGSLLLCLSAISVAVIIKSLIQVIK
jgi:hypothetical protein